MTIARFEIASDFKNATHEFLKTCLIGFSIFRSCLRKKVNHVLALQINIKTEKNYFY